MAFKPVNFKILTVFLETFLLYAKITVPIHRLCIIEKTGFGNRLFISRPKLIFKKKNYGFCTIYTIKSEMKSSSEGSGGDNCSCRSAKINCCINTRGLLLITLR